MPEMVAKLNAKIPAERKTINLNSDGLDKFDLIMIHFPTVPSSEQIQHSDRGNQYKERHS